MENKRRKARKHLVKWDKMPETGHPFPSPRVLPKMEDFQMVKTLSQEQKDKLYKILLRNYDVFVADSD